MVIYWLQKVLKLADAISDTCSTTSMYRGTFWKTSGISWIVAAATKSLITRYSMESTSVEYITEFRQPHKKKINGDRSNYPGGQALAGYSSAYPLVWKSGVWMIPVQWNELVLHHAGTRFHSCRNRLQHFRQHVL